MADDRLVYDILTGKNTLSGALKQNINLSKALGGAISTATGFLAANTITFGLRKISDAFTGSIQAAQVQEDAINRLNIALKNNGQFTNDVSRDLQQFASEIQKTTRFGDEAILGQLAYAQSLGVSAERSKEVVEAATNLSAALGISLESSVRNIVKTFSGLQGELGEALPALRNLTQEQLKAGDAVELVNQQFRGQAAEATKTYAGQVEQLSNNFGDFSEALGRFITQSDAATETTGFLSRAFATLTESLDDARSKLSPQTLDDFNRAIEVSAREADELNEKIIKLQSTTGGSFINRTEISNLQQLIALKEADIEKFGEQRDALAQLEQEKEAAAAAEAARINGQKEDLNSIQLLRESIREREREQAELDKELKIVEADENFQFLADNLGREQALKDIATAQELERQGKKNEAVKKLAESRAKAEKENIFAVQKFEELSNKQRLSNLQGTLGAISTLTASSNKTLFGIGKAAAISTATIDGFAAVQKALASAPPPFNFALAALVGVATGANIAKIASQQPPAFQDGGIVGGNSFSGDRVLARVNSGELILNQAQQDNIAGQLGGTSAGQLEAIANRPIIVQIDGREVARAVRDQVQSGFRLAS